MMPLCGWNTEAAKKPPSVHSGWFKWRFLKCTISRGTAQSQCSGTLQALAPEYGGFNWAMFRNIFGPARRLPAWFTYRFISKTTGPNFTGRSALFYLVLLYANRRFCQPFTSRHVCGFSSASWFIDALDNWPLCFVEGKTINSLYRPTTTQLLHPNVSC